MGEVEEREMCFIKDFGVRERGGDEDKGGKSEWDFYTEWEGIKDSEVYALYFSMVRSGGINVEKRGRLLEEW